MCLDMKQRAHDARYQLTLVSLKERLRSRPPGTIERNPRDMANAHHINTAEI